MRLYYTDGVFSMSLNQFEINLNQFEPGRSGSVMLMLLLLTLRICGRQPDRRPRQIDFLHCYDVLRRVSKCHEEQQDVDDLYERSCQRAENEERQPGYLRWVSTVHHQCISFIIYNVLIVDTHTTSI